MTLPTNLLIWTLPFWIEVKKSRKKKKKEKEKQKTNKQTNKQKNKKTKQQQ